MAPTGLLKKFLNVYKDENQEGNWVSLKEFISNLENTLDKDARKHFRSNNITREFKKGESKPINGDEAVPLSSLIAFVYKTRSKWSFCQGICDAIEAKLGYKSLDSNVLGFYKEVADYEFHKPRISDHLWEHINISCLSDDTLVSEYKQEFSHKQWNNICLFEHFFSKFSNNLKGLITNDQLIDKRKEFFLSLRSSREAASKIFNIATDDMRERKHRTDLADEEIQNIRSHKQMGENEAEFCFSSRGTLHKTVCIEDDVIKLISSLQSQFSGRVYCIECTSACQGHDPNGCVHIYVEFAPNEIPVNALTFETMSMSISSKVKKHSLLCASVIYLKQECVYRQIDRCQFRESMIQGDVTPCFQWINSEKELTAMSKKGKCQTCYSFSLYDNKPLKADTFSLEEEWYTKVPIVMQIFLESFINHRSCNLAKKHLGRSFFMKKKLVKLYSAYERLLACLNPKSVNVMRNLSAKYKAIGSLPQSDNNQTDLKKRYLLTLSPRKNCKRFKLQKRTNKTTTSKTKKNPSCTGISSQVEHSSSGILSSSTAAMCLQIPTRPMNLTQHNTNNTQHQDTATVLVQPTVPMHNTATTCQLTSAPLHFTHMNTSVPTVPRWPYPGVNVSTMWQQTPAPMNIPDNLDIPGSGFHGTATLPAWHHAHTHNMKYHQ